MQAGLINTKLSAVATGRQLRSGMAGVVTNSEGLNQNEGMGQATRAIG